MTLKSPRSSTIVSPESCHVIVLLAISVYNFRDIGRGNNNKRWNDLQMSFKVVERGTNQKVVFELLLVVYSNFPRITHRFLYTSRKQHFAYPLVFDAEFGGHNVGMWRRNLAPEN